MAILVALEEKIKFFIHCRDIIPRGIHDRLVEIMELAENALRILTGTTTLSKLDLSTFEEIIYTMLFKSQAIYCYSEFIEVILVDAKIWFDIKEHIIYPIEDLIARIILLFRKFDVAIRTPEIVIDYTEVDEMKKMMIELFAELLRKIGEVKESFPELSSLDEIRKRLGQLEGFVGE